MKLLQNSKFKQLNKEVNIILDSTIGYKKYHPYRNNKDVVENLNLRLKLALMLNMIGLRVVMDIYVKFILYYKCLFLKEFFLVIKKGGKENCKLYI